MKRPSNYTVEIQNEAGYPITADSYNTQADALWAARESSKEFAGCYVEVSAVWPDDSYYVASFRNGRKCRPIWETDPEIMAALARMEK